MDIGNAYVHYFNLVHLSNDAALSEAVLGQINLAYKIKTRELEYCVEIGEGGERPLAIILQQHFWCDPIGLISYPLTLADLVSGE